MFLHDLCNKSYDKLLVSVPVPEHYRTCMHALCTNFTTILHAVATNRCTSNPCDNGGTCTTGINLYTCQCAEGYHGGNCEITSSRSDT